MERRDARIEAILQQLQEQLSQLPVGTALNVSASVSKSGPVIVLEIESLGTIWPVRPL